MQRAYKAEFPKSGRPLIGVTVPASLGGGKALKVMDLPPGFSLADRHTMEFRAEGDLLTCLLDGREVASVRDGTLKESGFAYFVGEPGMLIEKLEYCDLSDPASAAVSPSPSLPNSSSPFSATKDAPFMNTLGMKFVPVPITGGPTNGKRVLFSVWETRVQDWAAYTTAVKKLLIGKVEHPQGPTHPVANVSWEMARDFCVWLTDRERKAGKLGAKERYRLPGDHEWSCAVGIGDKEDTTKRPMEKAGKLPNLFPWGAAWPPLAGAGNFAGEEVQPLVDAKKYPSFLREALPGYRDDFPETAPTGSFPANALGLHDLTGNVFEWCADEMETGEEERVARGGSWANSSRTYFLSSHRNPHKTTYMDRSQGFRCVLDEE